MNRLNLLYVLICSILTIPLVAQNDSHLTQKNAQHAQDWTTYLISALEPKDIQVAANVLYLLYANALIDVKIRQFIIPVTRLNQSIRSNIINYKNTAKELSILKTLLERLSHVIGARTIYNQKLKTCLDYYNAHQTSVLTYALEELQTYGQISLNEAAESYYTEMSKFLAISSQTFTANIQPLQDIAAIHENIANGSLSDMLKKDESTKQFAALILIDELLKNNTIAIQNTEHVLNTLDETSESVMQLILSATDIYKQHYEALYTYISSPTFDQAYACTLFGMNDLLPDEYKTSLPHPDHVFEHVLQTIKLYTQIELIQ